MILRIIAGTTQKLNASSTQWRGRRTMQSLQRWGNLVFNPKGISLAIWKLAYSTKGSRGTRNSSKCPQSALPKIIPTGPLSLSENENPHRKLRGGNIPRIQNALNHPTAIAKCWYSHKVKMLPTTIGIHLFTDRSMGDRSFEISPRNLGGIMRRARTGGVWNRPCAKCEKDVQKCLFHKKQLRISPSFWLFPKSLS